MALVGASKGGLTGLLDVATSELRVAALEHAAAAEANLARDAASAAVALGLDSDEDDAGDQDGDDHVSVGGMGGEEDEGATRKKTKEMNEDIKKCELYDAFNSEDIMCMSLGRAGCFMLR